MAPIAIVFGVLLTVLGPVLYLSSPNVEPSLTALIPSGFGIALIILGAVAMNENARKHAMHAAALLALIGFAIPAFMVTKAAFAPAGLDPHRHGGQAVMAVLCGIFLALCVKSFIDVRRARRARESESPPPAASV